MESKNVERYARQLILQNIGFEGQNKIFNAKVCLIGLGGLGSPVAYQLVGMGIGFLRIVDKDIVSLTDLHRQYLYSSNDVGRLKVEAAKERLKSLNPEVQIEAIPVSVTDFNVEDIVTGCNVVIDCTDSINARYLVNRACLKLGIPYLYGAAIENQGSAFTVLPGKTACLECIYPGLSDDDLPKCSIVGVNPPILSIIASVQVSEAIRVITNKQPVLAGKILLVDLQNLIFDYIDIKRSEKCEACSNYPNVKINKISKNFEIGCAREGKGIFYLSPYNNIKLDLNELNKRLKEAGYKELNKSELSITFMIEEGIKFNLNNYGFCVAQVDFEKANQEGFEKKLIDTYRKIIYEKF
jgi:Dinucleotide-utilizing enzymes involved in molybdopterin and thiamine biosynthesis family 2